MKTKKIFLVLNIIFLIAIVIGNILYFTVGGTKTETSLCFATLGLINLAYAVLRKTKNIKVPVAMAVGLILAMLGDITIDGNFVVGAGLFALGHIGFFVAYCLGGKFGKWDAILSTALFFGAGCFVLFSPILTFDVPVFKWVCLVYALIISLMVGKAVGNLIREKNLPNILFAIGSCLFFFSDLMLVFDWFTQAGSWSGFLCMGTYYPAQCFLSHAVYHFVNKNTEE